MDREVQAAMYRASLVQMRLGMFDDPEQIPWSHLGVDDVCTDDHLNLARDASRQGIVLLKNNKDTLPLNNDTVKSIANIGPHANDGEIMKGNVCIFYFIILSFARMITFL